MLDAQMSGADVLVNATLPDVPEMAMVPVASGMGRSGRAVFAPNPSATR